MTENFPWSVLGIEPTSDSRTIRKAYAREVKAMDLDADIERYAKLRTARDRALAIAKACPGTVETPPVLLTTEEQPTTPASAEERSASGPEDAWPLAAPRLSQGHSEGSVRSLPRSDQGDAARSFDAVFPDVPAERAIDATLELGANQSLSAPVLLGYGEIEAALGLIPGQSPFERLEAVLSEGPAPQLEEAERIVALRAQQAVIEDARSADIARQEQVENWLAGLLAANWPRSAPLLETATQAFNWRDEWHRFDARASVRFIGSHLRGARFRAKVDAPDHRYHRAWRELNRSGPAGPFRWLRASGADIQFVLSGIRANFPHVEAELDPRRVESWSRPVIWPRIVLGLCWLALVLHLLGVSWPFGPRGFKTPDGERIELSKEAPEPSVLGSYIDNAVEASFGKGHDLAWLWSRDPDLGKAIVIRMRDQMEDGHSPEQARANIANLVRQTTYIKGRSQDGKELDAAMRLRLAHLRAARAISPATCIALLDTAEFPEGASALPEDLLAREREAAARLASIKLPHETKDNGSGTIHIPGELVAKVLDGSGLDEAAVRQALQDKGDDAARCDVAIALLAATLDWDGPPETRTMILRSL